MSSYGSLAQFYDELTRDVNYTAFADFCQHIFDSGPQLKIHTVLDLACGTGSLTRILAERGYEMIAADQSPDMLMEARSKCMDLEMPPLFIQQPMEALDLYGTIDACVSCLDSVNYVTDPGCLQEAFQRIQCFLMPGGLFIFDVRPPEFLQSLNGQMFLDETEDVYCVWRAEYAEDTRICTYGVDLFERTGKGLWRRDCEEHEEYAYTVDELTGLLHAAGFAHVQVCGNYVLRPPLPGEERIVLIAKKDESWQMKSYES